LDQAKRNPGKIIRPGGTESGTILLMNIRRLFPLCILLALLLVSACGSKELKLSQLPPDAVVLAFGDSVTFGTGAPPGQSYPDALQALIKRKVVNAGVPGETSEQGLKRLPQVLAETRPRLVILCHGGNDILRRLDLGATSKNLTEMIKLIRAQGAEVVLVGVPKPKLIPETAGFYKSISEKMRVPLEDGIILEVLTTRDLKSDYIHPNAAGYARLAGGIEQLLKKYGAVQ
jgi:lysophospholipase L1-like esterase